MTIFYSSENSQYVAWTCFRNAHAHVVVLQSRISVESPLQSRPPNAGIGLVQLRCLCDNPVPQVVLHGDQLLHEDQPPFTGRNLDGWLLKVRASY